MAKTDPEAQRKFSLSDCTSLENEYGSFNLETLKFLMHFREFYFIFTNTYSFSLFLIHIIFSLFRFLSFSFSLFFFFFFLIKIFLFLPFEL
jgi:hypothetical protein